VKAGLVASYHRPGGNITGINILAIGLDAFYPKQFAAIFNSHMPPTLPAPVARHKRN